MTDKFTFYIDMPSATQVFPKNSTLKLVHYIDENWKGIKRIKLDGSFDLVNTDFDYIESVIGSEYLVFNIYENGTNLTGDLIYSGKIYDFNDFDYNQSVVTVKDFSNYDDYEIPFQIIEEEKYINNAYVFPVLTYYNIDSGLLYYNKTITTKAVKMEDFLNYIAIPYEFDKDNAWFDTETIQIDTLRMACLTDINGFGDGARKKISLKRVFELFEVMFRAYWYLDGIYFKFKNPSDLVVNILDLSTELENKKSKIYSTEKNYFAETIEFNDNNVQIQGDDWDEKICRLEYSRSNEKILRHQFKDFCTRYTEGGENYNTDGFFLCQVTSDDTMNVDSGYYTSTAEENMMFSPANLLNDYYRDYLFTNTDRYSICGDAATGYPTLFNDFINLPDVFTKLDSIQTMYEGIVYEKAGANQRIGRVLSQSTDLNSNITTFKCVEYKNEL